MQGRDAPQMTAVLSGQLLRLAPGITGELIGADTGGGGQRAKPCAAWSVHGWLSPAGVGGAQAAADVCDGHGTAEQMHVLRSVEELAQSETSAHTGAHRPRRTSVSSRLGSLQRIRTTEAGQRWGPSNLRCRPRERQREKRVAQLAVTKEKRTAEARHCRR